MDPLHTKSTSRMMAGDTQRKEPLPPRAKSVFSKSSKPQHRTLRSNNNKMANTPAATSTGITAPSGSAHASSGSGEGGGGGVQKARSDRQLLRGMRSLSLANGSSKNNASQRRRVTSSGRGCKDLEDIAAVILNKRAKNIVVMTGAGISTSSGIPDFRTPGTGLYDNLKQYKIPYPEAVFDIDYFMKNPRPFCSIAKELYPSGKFRPNFAHYFLRLLHEKGVLLRVYTQNIDGLERVAGIPPQKLVEAHGNFLTTSCIKCKMTHPTEEVKQLIFDGKVPRCKNNACFGLVKPDIVFFGEDLQKRFYYYLKDFPQADLLLVMGTSLEVEPFAGIVDSVPLYVPRLLFNREAVGPFERRRRVNDVVAAGDIVRRLQEFVRVLGWEQDMKQLIRDNDAQYKAAEPGEPGAKDASNAADKPSPLSQDPAVSGDVNPSGDKQTVKDNSTLKDPSSRTRLPPRSTENTTPIKISGQRSTSRNSHTNGPGSNPRSNPSGRNTSANRKHNGNSGPTAVASTASDSRKIYGPFVRRASQERQSSQHKSPESLPPVNVELVSMRNITPLNNLGLLSHANRKGTTNPLLPSLIGRQKPLPAFHTQRAMYRTVSNGYGTVAESSSSSGSSSDESDSSDGG